MNVSRIRSLVLLALLWSALGSATAWAARVYVRVAPPRPVVEVRPVAPGAGHVWVEGYHTWNGTAYVWVPGRWEAPPKKHARWVPGHWKHDRRHGWYWAEGHWR